MEEHLQNISKEGCPSDSVEAKYISGLSTIMVATIQDAKDRISQIEYIFCSQLFPSFQSKSQGMQKASEAMKAAEYAWKEKENNLLLQIEKLELEKQQLLDQNQALKIAKTKQLEEHGGNANQLIAKLENQKVIIDELRHTVMQKSKEVDEGMELQDKLLKMIQAKSAELVNQGKLLKEHEDRRNMLVAETKNLGKKVHELQEELRKKNEEIVRTNEKTETLLRQIESLMSENSNSEQHINELEKEKIKHAAKLVHLEEKMRKQTEEIDSGRKVQQQLLQENKLNGSGMLRNKQKLDEHEKEKKMLLDKVNCLEEKVNDLQVRLKHSTSELADSAPDLQKKLLEVIQTKTSELSSEKNKRRDIIDAYKRLKSQYNFLSTKIGLTTENMLPQIKLEEKEDSMRHHQNLVSSPGLESPNPDAPVASSGAKKLKNDVNDNLEEKIIVNPAHAPNAHTAASCFPTAQRRPSNTSSGAVVGTKRSASWRDTRSRQVQGGLDPHDDFLDTPLENARENMHKSIREEARNDSTSNDSDDETQDMNVNPSPQRMQNPAGATGKKPFKYVEPVRKKADRENLKGIECKQCKKFYDAVLPNNGGKDSDGNNIRCEHHEGVSRHRYKYLPPMTPEGFWNIGFESEM